MESTTQRLADAEVTVDRTTGRRSSLAGIGATILGALGLVSGLTSSRAAAQRTDADSRDPIRRGRGGGCGSCTDHDAYDVAGHGRHCRAHVCTDHDAHDATGHGRHCAERLCHDHDAYDRAFGGRRC